MNDWFYGGALLLQFSFSCKSSSPEEFQLIAVSHLGCLFWNFRNKQMITPSSNLKCSRNSLLPKCPATRKWWNWRHNCSRRQNDWIRSRIRPAGRRSLTSSYGQSPPSSPSQPSLWRVFMLARSLQRPNSRAEARAGKRDRTARHSQRRTPKKPGFPSTRNGKISRTV